MEAYPPYLFSDGDEDGAASVSVTCDVDTAVIEMTLRGRWSRRLGLKTFLGFRKCLAEHPAAIIVDLADLDDPLGASAPMWLAADRAAGRLQPRVRIALRSPPGGPLTHRLLRMGVERTLPIFSTMEHARSAVLGDEPLSDRLQLTRLPPQAASAGAARGLIDIAVEAWGFADLLHPGRLVMSELVANGVQHGRTDMVVTVWRRATGLHLSVHDGNPQLPRLKTPTPTVAWVGHAAEGNGLTIVDVLSAAWGAMPTRGGKMVWATMRSCRRRT